MTFLQKNLWWMSLLVASFVYFNFLQPKPCDSPIPYKIGRVDSGFGISKTELLTSLDSASKIWSSPINKNLFEYNQSGKLTVNLIYDDRQKTTQRNQVLKADVSKTNQLAGSLKQEYESMISHLESDKQSYNAELDAFNLKQKDYANQVDYWNGQGGAPTDVYNALAQTRTSLLAEQQNLEAKRLVINSLSDQINAFIQKYNLLVQNANENIDVINQTAGQEFQEGTYDPATDTINIYEFSTEDKLTRVLAHELGHAIGLDHNENSNSIMYALNKSNSLNLSAEDIAALKTLCKI